MSKCGNCGHPATSHLVSAAGTAPCQVRDERVSTSGIIGQRSVHHCECQNYSTRETPCTICKEPVYLCTEPTVKCTGYPSHDYKKIREADEVVHLVCKERKDWPRTGLNL